MKKQKGLPATPSQASPLAKQSEAARASGLRGGRGQTLIEILLAFSISILVLTSIAVGVTTSLSNSQYTRNQNLANSYAQEGMAVVRKIRDSSWYDFSNYKNLEELYTTNTIYCLDQNSMELEERALTSSVRNCGQNVGIFSREVKFEHNSPDCSAGGTPAPTPSQVPKGSKVTVKTSWTDNKCPVGSPYCHKTELISCFSNLDEKSLQSYVPPPISTPTPTPRPTSTPTPAPTPTPTPTPTPMPPQTPIQTTYAVGNFGGPYGWPDYTMGYRFNPSVNGRVTALWDYSAGGTKILKLWSDTGVVLNSVTVTGSNTRWVQGVLTTPTNVTAGTYYWVTTRIITPGGYWLPITTFPVTLGNIVIITGSYSIGDAFPTMPSGSGIHGIPDITFIPN